MVTDLAGAGAFQAGIGSGIYTGALRHRRFSPVPHEFTYPLFMVLLDIDRIGELMAVSRLTSWNRFNWATFDDRDHLGDPARPLRERLAEDAARRGVALPHGRILLLTHLRYLGYCFNPVSFFYCFEADERLEIVLAEVHNTFGGSWTYWVRPHDRAPKSMYVSPFLDMDLEYSFDFSSPGESLVAHMETMRSGDTIFDATLRLDRREWNAREIRRALVRHPAMTTSVMASIHWEALKLWWKGVPVVERPTSDGIPDRQTNPYAERTL
jgi:DUF1365 family protein